MPSLLAAFLAIEALAVAVWLLPATIRIVDWPASGPVRMALLAPKSHLFVLLAIGVVATGLLVVWANRSAERRHTLGRIAPLGLLWLWAVPYLPWAGDFVPLLLVLAGPIRWVIAAVAVIAATNASTWVAPVSRLAGITRPRAVVFGLSLAIYLLFGALSARALGPGGDEPHYLMISQSLLADGDLKIENNHRQEEYRAFTSMTLPPHYMMRGQDGEIYSIHAPGLPALLLPAYAIAGYPGSVFVLCLLAALTALAVFDLAYELRGSRAAWLTWAAVCLTVPFVPHAWLLFPEMPGTLIVAWSGLWMWRSNQAPATTWLWRGAALAALPWLHTKFVVFLALITLTLLVKLRQNVRLATYLLLPIAVSGVAWLYSFYAIYGTIDPQAPYGDYAKEFVINANIPHGVVGLLFDQKFGLLVYSPIYFAAIAGAWLLLKQSNTAYLGAVFALVAAAFVASSTRHYMWWGGSSAPARFLVPVVPLLAPMIAIAASRLSGSVGRALFAIALTASLLVAAAGALWPSDLYFFSDPHGRARLFQEIQGGAPLTETLPTFTEEEWLTPLVGLLPWAVAMIASLGVMATIGRRRASPLTTGLWGSLVLLLIAGSLTARPGAAVREAAAARGTIDLLWSYDAARHRPFDYVHLRTATADEFLATTRMVVRRMPAGPVALPPGSYEARVWFTGAMARQGEVVVSAPPHSILGRVDGMLNNPTIVPFSIPFGMSGISVTAPDERISGSVSHVELAARAIVPTDARPGLRPLTVEAITPGSGRFLLYTDESAYPEGGVFWTREKESSTVLVAPAGATRMVLTLHLGPNTGRVSVNVAGKDYSTDVPPNETTRVEVDVPPAMEFVPITVQSPVTFQPSAVDPASTDMRQLGCQVRVDLE